jgi:hypothetical protein
MRDSYPPLNSSSQARSPLKNEGASSLAEMADAQSFFLVGNRDPDPQFFRQLSANAAHLSALCL